MSAHEAYVVIGRSCGTEVRMAPGGLIGRLRSADLRIDDPRVSEAHAYVSLREGSLRLLALRGGLAVGGRLVREVPLTNGLRILLAKGDPPVELVVREVGHPDAMLALRGPGLDDEVLTGRSLALLRNPTLGLHEGYHPGAVAQLWTDGQGWTARIGDASPRSLAVGDLLDVGPDRIEVVQVALRKAHTPATDLDGAIARPVRIEGFFDTVHLHQPGQPALILTGAAARVIYELGTIGQPVNWRDVATTVWPGQDDEERLRKRWDVMLTRLRKRLVDSAIRPSLVQADGGGKVRLLLERADVFRDCG